MSIYKYKSITSIYCNGICKNQVRFVSYQLGFNMQTKTLYKIIQKVWILTSIGIVKSNVCGLSQNDSYLN